MALKNIGVGKYKIIIECGTDIFGIRRRKIVTFNGSLEEAKKEEARLMNKFYHEYNSIKNSDYTFGEFSEIFIEKYCKQELSDITTNGYIKSLKRINPIIGKLKLNKITPYILDNMYEKLKTGIKGEVVGYHSMNSYYKVVNLVFNTAIRWEILDKNPNKKAARPKKIHKEKNYYDVEQVKKLISVLENEPIKYRLLIHLALDSGARRSEICALRWSDISFETNLMSITKSLKVVNGKVDEKTTKTNSSVRRIVLSENTMKLLEEYHKWQEDYKIANKKRWKGTEDRIFTSIYGTHMHPCTCCHIIEKIVKKYDLDPISFHELRHTCASLLVNQGIDLKTVSSRMGHSNITTTMDIYTHSFDSAKIKCATKMDEILSDF